MRLTSLCWLILSLLLAAAPAIAKKDREAEKKPAAETPAAETPEVWSAGTFRGLGLRGIGPALTSGRVIDFAVHPEDRTRYYVAVASGGVWKTVNDGITWTPIFDDQGSYSIGTVTLDPNDPLTVWVGTGENNSQRSVGYGDGVYKSPDGGKTWKHMGLGESEHIGKIVVDPRDSNVVYVAAQGPLWRSGGDRGLYKSTDGGETWKLVLEISPDTGVSDLVMDPRDPDVLYASAYQRRRRVWTLINGGPESGLHKSTDGGETWRELETGLPTEEMGRIGLAVSPADPDVIYAIVEAANDAGGFFRSTDRGSTWEKRSGYVSLSPQYYQEIFADPQDVDRVYSMDVWMKVTEDGGKTFVDVGETYKHVDNHALWIDPENTDYLLAGCDGGVYETFDRGATWRFKANLPIVQFYKVSADNALPFYNVYGGTQDNFTLGGPARTVNQNGIMNRDWIVTLGGDGFATQADPEDPAIVYSQWQYGNLHRVDRVSGEIVDIQPQPAPGDDPIRFNWDAPFLISPHSHTRLYFASQRVYRSDDRGSSWRPISGDLSRQIDRNQLEVMGKVWSVDAVAKNVSTSPYGSVVAFTESPRVENLLYAGTDDGLVQVLEPGASEWRKIETFPGVPERTYVNDLQASLHSDDVVYAAFNNHKSGDFLPYALKSTDRGRTWTSIAGDLPERGSVYALAEDAEDPNLLFAGTEFGLYFTTDGGRRWVELEGGMPVVAVRDLDVQRRENDLVVGTFGRGIYILDDYTPLRRLTPERLDEPAILFPVKEAKMYMLAHPLGLRDKSFQGDSFYTAPNPPFGAVFTYYLKEPLETRQKKRRAAEKELEEEGGSVRYPSLEELRAEEREHEPAMLLTVRDPEGGVVRRVTGPATAGFHRVAWDLRYPHPQPVNLQPLVLNPFQDPPRGPMVAPGTYRVELATWADGVATPVGEAQTFEAVPLGLARLPAEDHAEVLAFQEETAKLQRAVLGAAGAAHEVSIRLDYLWQAVLDTPAADPALSARVLALSHRLADLRIDLEGDPTRRAINEPGLPGIVDRVDQIVSGHWTATAGPTGTHRQNYAVAAEAFGEWLPQFQALVADLEALEGELEGLGAPWTPGRVPTWSR